MGTKSDLLRLDQISKANGNIKAFPIDTNFKRANTGKNGWGEITIAVDNETVTRLATEKDLVGALYITTKEEFNNTMEEMK